MSENRRGDVLTHTVHASVNTLSMPCATEHVM